jgi:hypothetical protein
MDKDHRDDHKSKDMKHNKRKRDNICIHKGNQGMKNFKKGSDSNKPQTIMNCSKPANTNKEESQKIITQSLLEARAKHNKCKFCGSIKLECVLYKNAMKVFSGEEQRKPILDISMP